MGSSHIRWLNRAARCKAELCRVADSYTNYEFNADAELDRLCDANADAQLEPRGDAERHADELRIKRCDTA